MKELSGLEGCVACTVMAIMCGAMFGVVAAVAYWVFEALT